MANNYGRTGADIIAERKRRMQITGEDILRSRGKPIPEAPALHDPQPVLENVTRPKTITPTTVESSMPKTTTMPDITVNKAKPDNKLIGKMKSGVSNWLRPDKDEVRKKVFGITYENELDDAVKEYIRKTTETPSGQFGASFLSSASLGLVPKAVDILTPERTKEKYKELGYSNINDIYKEARAKGGIISSAGQIAGSLIPLSKISKASNAIVKGLGLTQKHPYLAQSLTRVLTGAIYGGGQAAGQGAKIADIAKETGRGALFMAAGGLASDVLGGAGKAALKLTPLKDSLTADVMLNVLQGATFGAVGTASTIPTYAKDERPSGKDIITSAVTMALFQAIPATINSIKMSKVTKQMLYTGMRDFEKEASGLYNAARTNSVKNPEESIRYYNELLNYINNNKSALQQNRFPGQGKVVNAAIELMDKLSGIASFEMDLVVKGTASNMDRYIGPVSTAQQPAGTSPVSPTSAPQDVIVRPGTAGNVEPLRPIPTRVPDVGKQGTVQQTDVRDSKSTTAQPKSVKTQSDAFKAGDVILDEKGKRWTVTGTNDKAMLDIVDDQGKRTKIGRKVAKKVSDSEHPVTKDSIRKIYEEISRENFDGKDKGFAISLKEIMKRGNFNEREFISFLEEMQRVPTTDYEFGTARDQRLTIKINGQNRSSITFYDDVKKSGTTYTEKELAEISRFAKTLTDKYFESEGKTYDEKMREDKYAGYVNFGKNVVDSINNKDIEYLNMLLTSGNPTFKRLFHALTGLPVDTNKIISESIRSLDPEGYDKYIIELTQRINDLVREAQEKEQRERETATKEAYERVGDIKHVIDGKYDSLINHVKRLFDEGYRIEKTNEYGGVIWTNPKTNEQIDISKFTKETRSFIKKETQKYLDELIEAETKKEQEEYNALPQKEKDEIDRLVGGKKKLTTQDPVEKKLDELDNKINTIIEAVKNNKIEGGETNAEIQTVETDTVRTVRPVRPGGESTDTSKGREYSDEGRSPEDGIRDQQQDSTREPIQSIQTSDEQLLSARDVDGSINENKSEGSSRDDTSGISGADKDSLHPGVQTGRHKGPDRVRKNLLLNVADDFVANTYKKEGKYYVSKKRRAMNEEVLKILDKPLDLITVEDKEILKNYSGKGGLGETGVEILTQYFTDYKTVDFIYQKLEKMGFKMDNIKALDPSTGVGVFMGFAPDDVNFDAIDIDPISAKIASILYPDSNVMNKGFEDHRVNNNYDLIITNVPFSTTRGAGVVKDKPDIKALHDYFLLASLDKAKDNGLIVVITPSSVMDSIDPSIRKKITADAELLSAYRLPSSVFEKTGTDVVTDILIFRRKARDSVDYDIIFENNTLFENVSLIGKKDIDYISWNNKILETAQIPLNSYYIQNKKNVLGEKEVKNNRYGQPIISVRGELTEVLTDRVLNDGAEYKPTVVVEEAEPKKSSNFIYFDSNDIDVTPIGGLFQKDGKWYRRETSKKLGVIIDKGIELKIKAEYIPVIKDLHKVAALSQSIRIAARKGEGDIKSLTADLKKSTNEFIKKHKKIFGEKQFIEVISSDPRYEIVKVLTSNPDIFKTDTLSVKNYNIPLNDTKNLTMLSKHLLYKFGKITIENFAQNYQGGIDKSKAEQILNSSDNFFKLPSFRIVEEFDAFSNVTYKTEEMNEVQYLPSTEYLIGDIYKKIDAVKDEIAKGHNEYKKNLKALEMVLPTPKKLDDVTLSIRAKWLDPQVIETFAKDHLGIEINVDFNKISGKYEVKVDKVYGYTGIYKTLKVNGTDFTGWIEKYLNNQEFIVYKNGEKDVVASANATKQMRKVDEVFKSYLKANPEVNMPIMDLYNRIFNNWVNKDYENDNLVIPGAHKNWRFRDNQLEFVNMALTLGTGVNAQRTGAGKTATNAAVNQMLKVTGRANKPVSVVPGKVIKKFVRDITKGSRGLPPIFPDMKILDVTDYSFNEALAMIAFNEWDLILMPDTWFKRIQVTPDRESVYIEQMLKDLELSETLRGVKKGSNRSQKDYEKRKLQLEAKLAELRNYVKVDSIYFEDLGIDAISLDEAQSVKNLVTSSKGSDLGLSATPSQTALDFNMKAKYIMEKKNGKNIFLYTATPVSNSMLEIYGLLQNIAPQEWTNRNIYTPDDFIDSVVDVSQTIGITTSNEVGTVNKVDGFINIDDLRGLFRKYVDYRPFIEGAKIPKVIETNITVTMNDYQRLYFADVLKRLQEIKAREPRTFYNSKGEEVTDGMLKVLGDASRVAISPSLVNGQIPTLENSPKVAKAIEIIAEIYKDTGKNQVVFMDDYGEVNLKENNFHNFIKRELVKKGVAEKEIVIVNGKINANVNKKLKIQDDFNDGKYKVIIGTTDSIGAGMDLQENTIAMINIDIPWTPTSVMQRRGRGERPGNINEEIKNINFFTKGSYDAWRAGIVAIKKKWQDQLLEGVNDNETGYLKNQDTDSFNIDDIMSELIEDPKEKAKFLKMAELSTTKSVISELKDSLTTAKRQINDLNNSIEERQRKIRVYEKEQIEKPDSKLPAMRIEQLTNTINSLNIDLLEQAKKRDDIEDQIRVKQLELDELSSKIKDMETQPETDGLKDIDSKLAYNADPGMRSPFSDEIGIINFNIGPDKNGSKNYETKEKYVFADTETERRWNAAKNVKGGILQESIAKLNEIWTEVKMFTTRGAIPYLERGAKYAQLRFNLILFKKQKEISTYQTLINLKGIVSKLDKKTYDLFSRKVALDDMLAEVAAGHDLAFGFTPDTVKMELDRINKEIEKYPAINEAITLRDALWKALKKEYTTVMTSIGFDVSEKFNRENYYRHSIIDHIQQSRITKGSSKLRTPTGADYLKHRAGSLKDYISDYLKAEAEVMANMRFDIAKAKLIKYIRNSEHNIKDGLMLTAKNNNKDFLKRVLATEAADKNVQRNNKGEGPIQQAITTYNKYIAIGFDGLAGIAEQGKLWTGDAGEFKDIISILNPESVDVFDDGDAASNRLYSYLAILANTEYPGSLQAKTILKYTSLKREFVKNLLGKNYETWDTIIPDDYGIWQPREGNHLYMAYSLSDKMAQELLSGFVQMLNISASDLKGVLAKGQPYEQYVLPKEVIHTLENFLMIKHESLTSNFLRNITNSWKQWQLISPRRAFKYNLRNFTGDAESMLMGNPAILKKALPAINDLYTAYFYNKPMTGSIFEWFSRGGMQSTLQVNEIDDINQLKIFVDLYSNNKTIGEKAINLFKGYWKNARLATDFREAILRYSAFLYAVEDINKNKGIPTSYWASLKSEVDSLSDVYDKAYLLSNDLLGAYDDISVMGQNLRKYAIPFWSWMEVNPKRYFRMMKNIANDNTFSAKVGEKTLKMVGVTGVRSLNMLARVGKFILYLIGFSTATQLWNWLFFRDLEDKLPKDVRNRTHIIFGEDSKTGDVIYFSRVGAISDILDWVGLDTAAVDLKEFIDGRLSVKEYITQMVQSPVNKLVNAAYPFHKLTYELLTGRSLFPDIFKQRQIRDKGLHIAQSLGIDREYRAIAGLPQRDGSYSGTIKDAFIYRSNPDESAYWNILNEKERFLAQENKPRGAGFWNDKKSNALYNFKVALRYKDWKAAEKYFFQYRTYGGTDAGIERGLKSMDPFYGLNDADALKFLLWLPENERDTLARAIKYYYDVVTLERASE